LNEALAAKLDLGQRLSAAQHEVSNLKRQSLLLLLLPLVGKEGPAHMPFIFAAPADKVEEQTEKAKFAVEQLESLRRSHEVSCTPQVLCRARQR